MRVSLQSTAVLCISIFSSVGQAFAVTKDKEAATSKAEMCSSEKLDFCFVQEALPSGEFKYYINAKDSSNPQTDHNPAINLVNQAAKESHSQEANIGG